ncbi:hypothetical protein EAO70_11325 [Streptomyces sp. adm13(2018)]|nr:hypothetical protein EAO70_11325 [Streptomyces sp. adm13(2018)]
MSCGGDPAAGSAAGSGACPRRTARSARSAPPTIEPQAASPETEPGRAGAGRGRRGGARPDGERSDGERPGGRGPVGSRGARPAEHRYGCASPRLITRRWIWLVPSKIWVILASRM